MMRTNSPDELEAFKREVSLPEYAASLGYRWNLLHSSQSSVTMEREEDHDRIVIARDTDEHWIYFNVGDIADSGSIIDFVQQRTGGNLGQARKVLRPWLGQGRTLPARPVPDSFPSTLVPLSQDTSLVAQQIAAMQLVTTHSYLEQERHIPTQLLTSSRFAACTLQDMTGKLCFPHHDLAGGICGAEIRSPSFKGFSPGGKKGLWQSNRLPDDTTLVMTESAIDSLSYAALHQPPHSCYVSVAGSLAPQQYDLLTQAITTLPAQGSVIIATDHDAGGNRLAQTLEQIIAKAQRPDLKIVRHAPPTPGQDWNDALRESSDRKPLQATTEQQTGRKSHESQATPAGRMLRHTSACAETGNSVRRG